MQTHAVLPYLIVALVLGMAVRRNLRSRRLRTERMWVLPALLLMAAVWAVAREPPHSLPGAASLTLAGIMGVAVGWQRGRLTRIGIDAETGVLTSQASPAAVILIVALFAARFGVREWLARHPQRGESLAVATDALVLFGAASIAVARAEMWLRCKRLIAAGAGAAA